MSTLTNLTLTAALFGFATLAHAGADCGSDPQDTWMSRADMQAKILAGGYTIDRFKIDDNCYEIYGRNADGQRVEVYYHPVTGDVVKEKVED